MQAEPSVSDPFAIPDTPEQDRLSDESTPVAGSPGTQGLDVTGASISSVTEEDGDSSSYPADKRASTSRQDNII